MWCQRSLRDIIQNYKSIAKGRKNQGSIPSGQKSAVFYHQQAILGVKSGRGFLPTTHTKECSMSQTLLEMAKDLVMAQIQARTLPPHEMHIALQQTYTTLMTLKAQEDSPGSVAVATPATPPKPVNWKKSITKHTVTCPGVWSQLQATVGQTSPGPWLGWTVLPRQV
jgi:hypothetical protein